VTILFTTDDDRGRSPVRATCRSTDSRIGAQRELDDAADELDAVAADIRAGLREQIDH
jgi:hypothetical protein